MKRAIITIIIIFMMAGYAFADTWQPIIGIPEPPFGITTDHNTLYGPGSGAAYDYPDDGPIGPIPYRIGPDGPYTHYIDPNHPSATNTNNPNGTPAVPRLSYPINWTNLPAGTVVEIHNVAPGGGTFYGNGTLASPIFIRGVSGSEPVMSALGGYIVEGSYYIFENIKFDMNGNDNKRFTFGAYNNAVTHIAVRNCEFYNGRSVPISSYQVIRARLKDGSTNLIKNLIFYNNTFHDIGEQRVTAVKGDAIGISLDSNVRNVWIVYNEFYHIGGDGIQLAWDSYLEGTAMPQFVYVGKNTAHDNYENFIDLKMCQDVIVSQNTAYNFGDAYSSYSGPTAIPYRYGLGEGPGGIARNNIWTLFNVAYNYSSGDGGFSSFTGTGETRADEIYYIGNLAYNSRNPAGNSTAFFSSGQEKIYWLSNTSYNCDRGGFFIGDNVGDTPTEKITLINNIFGYTDFSSSNPYPLQIGGTPDSLSRAVITNNVFFNSNGNAKYRVGVWNPSPADWTTYPTYSAFCTAYPSFCTGPVEGNPEHVDPINGNFHLKTVSPAINAGAAHNAYATFQSRYGINIQVDFENNPVPYGTYDIGTYEYSRPLPPKNLRIKQ